MSDRWTPEDLANYQNRSGKTRKRTPVATAKVVAAKAPTANVEPIASKYRNRRTEAEGFMFASRREAKRYEQLRLTELAGLIRDLRIQVRFRLEANGKKICDYIADFVYFEGDKQVVEDSKGFRTPVFLLKKKMMAAILGIEIRET